MNSQLTYPVANGIINPLPLMTPPLLDEPPLETGGGGVCSKISFCSSAIAIISAADKRSLSNCCICFANSCFCCSNFS